MLFRSLNVMSTPAVAATAVFQEAQPIEAPTPPPPTAGRRTSDRTLPITLLPDSRHQR